MTASVPTKINEAAEEMAAAKALIARVPRPGDAMGSALHHLAVAYRARVLDMAAIMAKRIRREVALDKKNRGKFVGEPDGSDAHLTPRLVTVRELCIKMLDQRSPVLDPHVVLLGSYHAQCSHNTEQGWGFDELLSEAGYLMACDLLDAAVELGIVTADDARPFVLEGMGAPDRCFIAAELDARREAGRRLDKWIEALAPVGSLWKPVRRTKQFPGNAYRVVRTDHRGYHVFLREVGKKKVSFRFYMAFDHRDSPQFRRIDRPAAAGGKAVGS